MKVEYLRAWEDRMWDTITVDVPTKDVGDTIDELLEYAHRHLADLPEHRKAVLWAVYAISDEEECGADLGSGELGSAMHGWCGR